MAADGSGSGFTKVTPVYTKPGSPVPVPFSVTGDVPPPAPLPLTGDETFTVYVDDIPMFTTIADALDTGVSSFNGRGGAVVLTTADITSAGGAPIDSPVFTGNPQAPTPTTGDNSNSIATTEFVTTAVDATFQDFLPITGGVLAGPGNLTVGGILSVTGNTVTSGIITNNAGYYVASSGPGALKGLELDTGNLQRWTLFSDNTAELGANAGSNFQLSAYSDAGALLNTPISIQRSTGVVTLNTGVVIGGGLSVTNLANFTSTINVPTAPAGTSSTLAASTAFVTNAIGALPPPNPGTVTSVGFVATPNTVFGVIGSPVTGSGTINLVLQGQPQNSVLAAPVGGGGIPNFRLLSPADIPLLGYLPLSGGAITGPVTAPTPTAGDNSTNVATTAFVEAAIAAGGGGPGGGGTVTSVGLTMPALFNVANSPITTSGVLAVNIPDQGQNTVWAGPATGGSGQPTFRALNAADIPPNLGYLPLTGGTLTGPLVGTTISTSASITAGTYYNFGNSPANWYMWFDATAVQWKFSTPSFSDAVAFTAAGAITTRGGLTLRGNAVITGTLSVTLAATLSNTLTVTGVSALNGGSTTVTRPPGDDTTNIATTAFVTAAVAAGGGGGGGIPEAPTDGQIYGREGENTSWQPVLPLTGGTLTGPLTINTTGAGLNIAPTSSNAIITLNKSSATNLNRIQGASAGTPRWNLDLGTNEAETGSNAGSNFALWGYGDNGVQFSTALLRINRSNQAASFFGTVTGLDFIISGTKPANMVWAGPASGPAAAPTWRALTAADIPGGGSGAYLPLTGGTLTGTLELPTLAYSNTNWYESATASTYSLSFSGTGALLQLDSSGNLYTSTLHSTNPSALLSLEGTAGNYRSIQFESSGLMRWDIICDNSPESGSNAGSNFIIARYADNGNWIDSPVTINRATGNVTLQDNLVANGTIQAGQGIYTNVGFYANAPAASLYLNGQAGNYRDLQYLTNGLSRWRIDCDPSAESGGNAGSNLVIYSYADDGSYIGAPFQIVRSSSQAYFLSSVTIGNGGSGNLYMTGTGAVAWPTGYYYVSNGEHVWVGSGTLATLDNSGNFIANGAITSGLNITSDGGNFVANNNAGTYRGLQIHSAHTVRWWIACDTSAESGGNAGSNLFIANYDDAGNNLDSPFQMNRATGNALFTHQLQANGDIISEGSFHTPNNAYVGNALYWGGGTWFDYVAGNATRYMIAPSGDCYMDVNGNFVSSMSLYATDYVYANGGWLIANGTAGTQRGLQIQTSSSPRWLIIADGSAEGGSNTGSNFAIVQYSDAGASLGNALTINRSNGQAVFAGSLITNTNFSAGSNITAGGTLRVNGGAVYISSVVQSTRGVMLQTSGSNRWYIYVNGTNETGSNAGSDFAIASYSDAGANIAVPLTINRASGTVTVGNGGLNVNGGGIGLQNSNIQVNSNNWPTLVLNKSASGQGVQVLGETIGNARWSLQLGNSNAESGGNAGSDFGLYSYADNGSYIGQPLAISRSSGAAVFSSNLLVGGQITTNTYASEGNAQIVCGYFASGSWYNAERAGVAVGGATGVFFYGNGANYTQWSTVVSDRRLKFNLKPAGDALGFVKRLAVYDLDFKPRGEAHEGFAEPPVEHWPFSLIADEVGEVMPHAAIRGIDNDADQWVGLHPLHLVSTLWKAVQQLNDKVETLEARLAAVGG